jgi:hypothetical protein
VEADDLANKIIDLLTERYSGYDHNGMPLRFPPESGETMLEGLGEAVAIVALNLGTGMDINSAIAAVVRAAQAFERECREEHWDWAAAPSFKTIDGGGNDWRHALEAMTDDRNDTKRRAAGDEHSRAEGDTDAIRRDLPIAEAAEGHVVHPQGRRRVRRPHGGCARPLCRAA